MRAPTPNREEKIKQRRRGRGKNSRKKKKKMSSPMSSILVLPQNYSHQHGGYLDQLGSDQKPLDGFTDHISMNPSYFIQQNSMQDSYAVHQIHGSAAHKSLMTEHLPFYHQTPPVYTQHLNPGLGDPMIRLQPEQQVPATQPQQIERKSIGEEVLVIKFERPSFGRGKPRLLWTNELHARFVRAVSELSECSDIYSVRPKAILKKMNVEGLTLDHIKSHLQKYRAGVTKKSMRQGIQNSVNNHSSPLAGQGFPTSSSTAPVNSKAPVNGIGLESANIKDYGNLLQGFESPNYYQNSMFAPMGDYQDAVETPIDIENLLFEPMGGYGGNTYGPNFGLQGPL